MKPILFLLLFCTTLLRAEDVFLVESNRSSAYLKSHNYYKSVTPGWDASKNHTLYLFSVVESTNKLDARVLLVVPSSRTNLLSAPDKLQIKDSKTIVQEGWSINTNKIPK